jgi:hypothetical protein
MMTITNRIKAMVNEVNALNNRGEYGGRAAQVERELRNDVMFAGWSSAGAHLYRAANGRRVKSFAKAFASYSR